jgi:hypothetical protein
MPCSPDPAQHGRSPCRGTRARHRRALGAGRAILLAALFCLLVEAAAAEQLVGRTRVIDGDTITVGGVTVRLKGIAAPEMPRNASPGEPGGHEATAFMEHLAGGRTAVCELRADVGPAGRLLLGGRDGSRRSDRAGRPRARLPALLWRPLCGGRARCGACLALSRVLQIALACIQGTGFLSEPATNGDC